MKVQLLKSIPDLGRAGQIIEVSDAQARNQLFPSKLAVAATESVVAAHQRRVGQQERRQAQEQRRLDEVAKQLTGGTVTLRGKANPQGKLFAALKSADIQRALEEQFSIKLPGLRTTPDHLKTVGQHAVQADLDEHHSVTINVDIQHGQ